MKDYYDENEYENNGEEEYDGLESHESRVSTRLLTLIQITVCAIVLLTVLFLRISGGSAYHVIREWYVQNINKTIIPDENIQNVREKVIELFPAPSEASAGESSVSGASSGQASSSQVSAGAQGAADSKADNAAQSSASAQSGSSSGATPAVSSKSGAASIPSVESQKLN